MNNLDFTEEQIERYSRHILLSEVGVKGQKKLLKAKVLMIGAGGLGSPALLYLAGAGVGTIGIVDSDRVELSNLQRQIIHSVEDIGKNKALSAKISIKNINPDCEVKVFSERLTSKNIKGIIKGYDVVLDGSDNFPTRFLVADCCWFERIPLVSAAVLRFEGQLMTIFPGRNNPCYRCLFPEPPPPGLIPTCQEVGILGAVVGVMGTLQVVETLKILLGIGNNMSHRLLIYDAIRNRFTIINRTSNPECPLCGNKPNITKLIDYDTKCISGTEM